MTNKTFIVGGDLHIEREYDPSILMQFTSDIIKKRPDNIVLVGDLGDFKSQNKLVKDRGLFTLAEEVDYVVEILDTYLFKPLQHFQDRLVAGKRKRYKPHFIICFGNHESEEAQAMLMERLGDYGINFCPHKSSILVDGVLFSHTYTKGNSGFACTSPYEIMHENLMCSVAGHSHVRGIYEVKDGTGRPMFAIQTPCMHTEYPEWAGQSSLNWSRGYLLLEVSLDNTERVENYKYYFKGV